MDTTTSALLTTVIVVAGSWADDKQVTARMVLGGVFLAIVLAVLAKADEKLARGFALLVLITATLTYGAKVVEATGIAKTK